MTDRVRVSDKGDPYRSRKYYDKALEIQLINILPSQRDKQYGLTKKQAYMLLSEGLMLTHQQGNLKAYTSYVHDRHI